MVTWVCPMPNGDNADAVYRAFLIAAVVLPHRKLASGQVYDAWDVSQWIRHHRTSVYGGAFARPAALLRPVGSKLFDLGEVFDLAAGLNDGQTPPRFLLDAGRSHSAPFRQVGLDLAQTFSELAGSSDEVVLLVMMESYGEVDQALDEPALGLMGAGPEFFENFVALIKLASIEQLDAPVE